MKKPLTLRQLRIMLNGAKWSDFENGCLHRGGVQFTLHRGAFLGRLCYAAAAQGMFVAVQFRFTSFSKGLAWPLSLDRIYRNPAPYDRFLSEPHIKTYINTEENADA